MGSDPEIENFELIKSGEGGDIGVYRVKSLATVEPLSTTEGHASIVLGQKRQSEVAAFPSNTLHLRALVRTPDYVSRVKLGPGA